MKVKSQKSKVKSELSNNSLRLTTNSLRLKVMVALLCLFTGIAACKHDHLPTISTGGHDYAQINLVADSTDLGAARTDSNLSTPWGMAVSPKGTIWICCNHNGRCVTYDSNGNQRYSPVPTSLKGVPNGASPNGIIFNNTQDFTVNGEPVYCICSTDDGALIAWIGGDSTITVADRSASGAVYKGITIANDGTGNFIYATDFLNAKIDVFDKSFNYITSKPFADPNMPSGFAPFNICNIGGQLFVTYAKQKSPDFHDEQYGAGNGYVDVFNPNGSLIKRFASQGTLNAPWGIVQAPAGFGQVANAILVANYGDGHITVFDTSGAYQGLIENNGNPVSIEGLCDISFVGANSSQLYFTSGPSYQASGLFGYLKVQ
jgi:uncharacterized protein (TIGR03118 family)